MREALDKREELVITSQSMVSRDEAALLALVTDVGFGHIGPVVVPEENKTEMRYLNTHQIIFLAVVREYQTIERIVVHQGSVQYVEVSGIKNNWKYIKKIKLSD